MNIYFSDVFDVTPALLEKYGAFNISLISDLPLFIDPFLLFNSKKRQYQKLHDDIITYLRFLKDKAVSSTLNPGLLNAWYRFPEVKQNYLGFCVGGNTGSGLGKQFADSLQSNLQQLFGNFGSETVTKGSHLEKLCLIRARVGKDNISDFTTNLIKAFLLEYTQAFAVKHIAPENRKTQTIQKVAFNYTTESWQVGTFDLPFWGGDYVLLTPKDILTKDDIWINKHDMLHDYSSIPVSIPNDQLRAQVNNYFRAVLPKNPKQTERDDAARKTYLRFPQLIDYYIRHKEDDGDRATSASRLKVLESHQLYVEQFKALVELLAKQTGFYGIPGTTHDEALARIQFLKQVIENQDGYKMFYVNGKPIERESDLQILYRLTWFATPSDVNREVNNGRGPVDFKISRGSRDKTLVEFKLASNSSLERNLEAQVEIYEKANDAKKSFKVIIYFSPSDLARVQRILRKLKMEKNPFIILIDARKDNKPSASKAKKQPDLF
ncbi:MAG: hypothetical protein ACYDH9_21200 [Limisphaerales bacterium]